MLVDIDAAHAEYAGLTKVNDIIKGPPLFCRSSNYGTTSGSGLKFGHVFTKILLPLSLEYYLRTRPVELRYIKNRFSSGLTSTDRATKEDAIRLIAGNDQGLQNALKSSLATTSGDVEASLDALNRARRDRIFSILDYLEDQGWAEGSAIGSLDHEMNRAAGFVHSVFLLKAALQTDPARLRRMIDTAKWYTDFGEIYQTTFEFDGSTADRIKTFLLYRLQVILVMPDGADKVRDIRAYQRWMDNALKINQAMGGLIKPDFTSFHHKGFYPSAYTSYALHTASLVYHLLIESSFQMSTDSVQNLKGALHVLYVVNVLYSVPISVGGRYPNFTHTSFVRIIPAFAYMSEHYADGLYTIDQHEAEMFGRLAAPGDTVFRDFLIKGKTSPKNGYLNSIGSLAIMERVSVAAGRAVGSPPSGNWAKNFAALSIHRRDQWQVSVKGFNKYVWDFEASNKENRFGLFQSHGAVQISNDQASLASQNTAAGWEWMKVPGATTIDLTLDEMKTEGDRYFNPKPLAGGLTFVGSSSLANGLFGMDFSQPKYKKALLKNIDFMFKKSVFFFGNLLVCMGSGITVSDPTSRNRKALTTLFQKIQLDPSLTSIQVNGVEKVLSTPYSASAFTTDTKLMDTNGNGFFIPAGTAPSLQVKISDQTSRDEADEHDTSARYSTTWLEHTQADAHYEYAVMVESNKYAFNIDSLATAQASNEPVYRVLERSASAHVVEHLKSPRIGRALVAPVVGYVIFQGPATNLPTGGPIEAVDEPCLVMAEESDTTIKLSVSSPDLAFTKKKLENAQDVDVDALYNYKSEQVTVRVTFTYKEGAISLMSNGAFWHDGVQPNSPPDVKVESRRLSNEEFENVVSFKNMANGFSLEAHFFKEAAAVVSP